MHIIEPNLIGSSVSRLGKDQNSRRNACVGLEHSRGHRNNRLKTILLYNGLANCLVRPRRAKEHSIGNDNRASAAHAEHTQHQRQEQKLCLFGFANLEKVGRNGIVIQAPLKRRVRQNEGVLLFIGVLIGQTITVLNIGVVHSVRHHIHRANAEHGSIHIVAVEHTVHIVSFFLSIEEDLFLALFLEVVPCRHKKARRTAGRVADDFIGRGIHQFHHHANNVARCAELTVQSRLRNFGKQVFVNVTADVGILKLRHLRVDVIENGDDLIEQQRRGDFENGIVHILGICAFFIVVQILNKRKHPLLNRCIHLACGKIVEHRPLELLAVDLSVANHHFFGENAFVRESQHHRLLGTHIVGFIKIVNKHQICDLLDNVKRVYKSACGKHIPKTVNSIFQFTCNHFQFSLS